MQCWQVYRSDLRPLKEVPSLDLDPMSVKTVAWAGLTQALLYRGPEMLTAEESLCPVEAARPEHWWEPCRHPGCEWRQA